MFLDLVCEYEYSYAAVTDPVICLVVGHGGTGEVSNYHFKLL